MFWDRRNYESRLETRLLSGVRFMDAADELTMVVGMILVLGLAYMGVTFWSKKAGTPSSGGPGGGQGGIGEKGSAQQEAIDKLLLDEVQEKKSGGVKRDGQLRERFQLQGKDAEMAAKVLKRMLKQK